MSYENLQKSLAESKDWALQRDVVGYTAAIGASESASQWWAAVRLFSSMAAMALEANVVTYTAVISACGKAWVQNCTNSTDFI